MRIPAVGDRVPVELTRITPTVSTLRRSRPRPSRGAYSARTRRVLGSAPQWTRDCPTMTRRPVVVLSRDAATPRLRRALAVAITSTRSSRCRSGCSRTSPLVRCGCCQRSQRHVIPIPRLSFEPHASSCHADMATEHATCAGQSTHRLQVAETPTYKVFCSAPGRNRTCDTRFRKPMLYPLSYRGGMFAMGFA